MELGEPLDDPSAPRSNGEILQKTAKVRYLSICCAVFLTHPFSSFFPKHFKKIKIKSTTLIHKALTGALQKPLNDLLCELDFNISLLNSSTNPPLSSKCLL